MIADVLAGRAAWAVETGDVLERLAQMPDESVNCVVTSPPYWGLRDYGTARWEGGDPGCKHVERVMKPSASSTLQDHGADGRSPQLDALPGIPYRDRCGKCGAVRVDRQIGLEPTPEAFVARMVAVFREVRRVLRSDGTCWVNLGDSYAGSWGAQSRPNGTDAGSTLGGGSMLSARQIEAHPKGQTHTGSLKNTPGLKNKDLVGIPWRVAFALQADGWWLRSDIVWAKKNCMPESVTDRPTRSHEYLFLLTKSARYWYDADAIREEAASRPDEWEHVPESKGYNVGGRLDGGVAQTGNAQTSKGLHRQAGGVYHPLGRNRRTVWTIATEPYPDAHFATFPTALVEPCVLAGCPVGGVVLDPFAGSGTTLLVALRHGRRAVGIDLNPKYVEMASRRIFLDCPMFNTPTGEAAG